MSSKLKFSFFRLFQFSKVSSQEVDKVIRLGTFFRSIWPVFPPIFFYQYIRQTDAEKFATELLYLKSGSTKPNSFDDPSRPHCSGHWRVQRDLDLIWKEANPELI